MKVIMLGILLALFSVMGCMQENQVVGVPGVVYNDTEPIIVANATEMIVNYDLGLTPMQINDSINAAGTPAFVRYSIRNAVANDTIKMNAPPCWGVNVSAPACPGDGIMILINRSDPRIIPLTKVTKIAGYAGENIGGVVTTNDVHGDALGMRILHETEHEVGLPADGMLGECKEKFVEYLNEIGEADLARKAMCNISTFYMQILFHDWLAETNPGNFEHNSL